MLWIIGGPTSVGKSTFIHSPQCQALTGVAGDARVVWPNSQEDLEAFARIDGFYHYNLLRPHNAFQQATRQAARLGRPAPARVPTFAEDPPWQALMAVAVPKRAIALVTSEATLLARIARRAVIEATALSGRAEKPYKSERWREMVVAADLASLYRDWLAQLRAHAIPYQLMLSEGDDYTVIDEAELDVRIGSHRATRESDKSYA